MRENTDQKKLRMWTLFSQWRFNPYWSSVTFLYPLKTCDISIPPGGTLWLTLRKVTLIRIYRLQIRSGNNCPVDTGRKLNVHKTFRKRPGRLLSVLCTLNLRPVSTEWSSLYSYGCKCGRGAKMWYQVGVFTTQIPGQLNLNGDIFFVFSNIVINSFWSVNCILVTWSSWCQEESLEQDSTSCHVWIFRFSREV